MAFLFPDVGDWYRLQGGSPFEVVAVDEDDGTLEVQYVDGTVEEIDLADWRAWTEQRALQATDPSEDWSDAADVEADEGHPQAHADHADEPELWSWLPKRGLDDLDLFDAV